MKKSSCIIEDNPFGLLVDKGLIPISSMVPEQSFFITGTSKSIGPAFRIAFMGVPQIYVAHLISVLNNMTWNASTINAEIITQLISSNLYKEIVDRKIEILKARNQLMDEVLGDYHLIRSNTSFLRLLMLPPNLSDKDIEVYCLKQGVQVFSSKRFSVSIHPQINAIRLSVSGPKNMNELKKGLEIIRDTIDFRQGDSHLII